MTINLTNFVPIVEWDPESPRGSESPALKGRVAAISSSRLSSHSSARESDDSNARLSDDLANQRIVVDEMSNNLPALPAVPQSDETKGNDVLEISDSSDDDDGDDGRRDESVTTTNNGTENVNNETIRNRSDKRDDDDDDDDESSSFELVDLDGNPVQSDQADELLALGSNARTEISKSNDTADDEELDALLAEGEAEISARMERQESVRTTYGDLIED